MLTLAGRIADAASAMGWACIAIYFVWRYVKHRKLVSLMIACMALGWTSACLGGVLNIGFAPWRGFVALLLACAVGYAIVRVERTGR